MNDATAAAIAAEPPREEGLVARLKQDKPMLGLLVGLLAALAAVPLVPQTITGLPAHPLLLHMPVIFVPCLMIAAIAFAWRADWRRRYGIAYGFGAIVTAFGTLAAAGAGEAYLAEKTGVHEGQAVPARIAQSSDYQLLQNHAHLGDATKIAVLVLALAIVAQIAIDRGALGKPGEWFAAPRGFLATALAAATTLLAVASGVLVLLTGHAGAKATFGDESRDRAGGAAGAAAPGFRDPDGGDFSGSGGASGYPSR